MRMIIALAIALSTAATCAVGHANAQSSPAGPSFSSMPQSTKEAWAKVMEALKAKGYAVDMVDTEEPNKVVFDFSKEEKTKGQGLLGVKWNRHLNGQATYYFDGSAWKLVNVNVKAQEKPPLFGDWAPVESDKEAKAVASEFRNQYWRIN